MINLENVSSVEIKKISQIVEDYYSSVGTKKNITINLFTNENQINLPATKKRIHIEEEFGNNEDIPLFQAYLMLFNMWILMLI